MSLTNTPWKRNAPKPPAVALIDADLRRRLLARAGGYDEITGDRLIAPPDIHHRKKKSQGRDDRPCNLLVVSRRTHHKVGQFEGWAREHGFIVSAYDDPADIALVLHCKRYVLLGEDFTYIDGETGVAL